QLDTLLQATFLDLFGDPVTNPKGWEKVPFNEVGEFVSGGTPSKEREDFWIGKTPWVSPKDMKIAYIKDAQDHVSESAFQETTLKLLEPGHLLIVVRGMILAHSFPAAVNLVDVAINQDMKAINPSKDFDVNFLLECFRRLKREILANVSTAGHGTKRFDLKGMKEIGVIVPPVNLQRRFVAVMETIEGQKTAHRAHLAELDALFATLQSRAFRGEL
ncbi:MAG: restriction endonuclease subunit S, partial [Tepidisphaeraceae bacterium]